MKFTLVITSLPALISLAQAEVNDITPRDAKKLLTGKNPPLVIDIRTKEEFTQGHIKNAVHIDFLQQKFSDSLSKLDKNKTYIFHCKSGGRSTRAIPTFDKLGFKKLLHLKAGSDGWKKAK